MSTRPAAGRDRFRAALGAGAERPAVQIPPGPSVEVVGPVSPVVGRRLTRTITSLDPTQHRFIRVLAVERELSVAALLRAMIDRLEHDPEFREETVREAPRFLW